MGGRLLVPGANGFLAAVFLSKPVEGSRRSEGAVALFDGCGCCDCRSCGCCGGDCCLVMVCAGEVTGGDGGAL